VEITGTRVKLVSDKADKLKAYCTITVDREFVIRDIKVIKGSRGCFVAMPSRKLMDRCPGCGGKNHLRASYCNDCGGNLPPNRVTHDSEGRAKLHADIAHPINSACRERIQERIIAAYEEELQETRRPDYAAAEDEDDYEDEGDDYDEGDTEPEERPSEPEPEPESARPEPEPAEPERQAAQAPPTEPDPHVPPPQPPEGPRNDSFSSGIL
jgi:stage V sporulation protein G